MGGLCFKSEETLPTKQDQQQPLTKMNRKVTVREEEMVIAKLKIQQDRLDTRLDKLEKEEKSIHEKIQDNIRQNKKEEAYFLLKKLKTVRQHQKDARTKVTFIDNQIMNIENTLDDVKFGQTIKESNRAIENLNKELDMEEIRIAKELQEEGKMRREELDELMDDDDDNDIKNELDNIEKGLLSDQFESFDKNNKSPKKIDAAKKVTKDQYVDDEPQAMMN